MDDWNARVDDIAVASLSPVRNTLLRSTLGESGSAAQSPDRTAAGISESRRPAKTLGLRVGARGALYAHQHQRRPATTASSSSSSAAQPPVEQRRMGSSSDSIPQCSGTTVSENVSPLSARRVAHAHVFHHSQAHAARADVGIVGAAAAAGGWNSAHPVGRSRHGLSPQTSLDVCSPTASSSSRAAIAALFRHFGGRVRYAQIAAVLHCASLPSDPTACDEVWFHLVAGLALPYVSEERFVEVLAARGARVVHPADWPAVEAAPSADGVESPAVALFSTLSVSCDDGLDTVNRRRNDASSDAGQLPAAAATPGSTSKHGHQKRVASPATSASSNNSSAATARMRTPPKQIVPLQTRGSPSSASKQQQRVQSSPLSPSARRVADSQANSAVVSTSRNAAHDQHQQHQSATMIPTVRQRAIANCPFGVAVTGGLPPVVPVSHVHVHHQQQKQQHQDAGHRAMLHAPEHDNDIVQSTGTTPRQVGGARGTPSPVPRAPSPTLSAARTLRNNNVRAASVASNEPAESAGAYRRVGQRYSDPFEDTEPFERATKLDTTAVVSPPQDDEKRRGVGSPVSGGPLVAEKSEGPSVLDRSTPQQARISASRTRGNDKASHLLNSSAPATTPGGRSARSSASRPLPSGLAECSFRPVINERSRSLVGRRLHDDDDDDGRVGGGDDDDDRGEHVSHARARNRYLHETTVSSAHKMRSATDVSIASSRHGASSSSIRCASSGAMSPVPLLAASPSTNHHRAPLGGPCRDAFSSSPAASSHPRPHPRRGEPFRAMYPGAPVDPLPGDCNSSTLLALRMQRGNNGNSSSSPAAAAAVTREELRECTFRPHVNKVAYADAARSRLGVVAVKRPASFESAVERLRRGADRRRDAAQTDTHHVGDAGAKENRSRASSVCSSVTSSGVGPAAAAASQKRRIAVAGATAPVCAGSSGGAGGSYADRWARTVLTNATRDALTTSSRLPMFR